VTLVTTTSVNARRQIEDAVAGWADDVIALSHSLHAEPELGFEEHRSSAKVARLLSAGGFEVETGVAGLDTAFVATTGTGEQIEQPLPEMKAQADVLVQTCRITREALDVTVERYAGYLRRILAGMAADETRPVDRLALLSAEERGRVVEEWNRTEAPYPGDYIHERFEAQARARAAGQPAAGDPAPEVDESQATQRGRRS
jgi:non-ribosomal peptide synthetase component F